MPYKIEKRGNKYVVVNKKTGKVKGTHSSREKALRQMRLLYGIEHGWTPTFSKRALTKAVKGK
ncbi:MAG: hypothetical protein QXS37_04500 [Candidatus Aenigmatarchaeota archaeon]